MDRVVKALNDLIRKEKKTVYAVAKAISIDKGSLYKTLRDGGNLGAKTVDKILEHFGYEIRLVKSKRKEVKPRRSKSKKGKEVNYNGTVPKRKGLVD